ncbi:hypothetical protein GH714_040889 [Hevea brasiliensis]|uniref:t-SNARE coiled-coil homology domain-containing protein n=1 Tax=Hevea brasiliensis TaxID=3981 RepID=A0A6A6MLF3_HEVBR|nr:hypothetical protein GH714_040889 [Hevea brasiliensis]
MFGLKKSPLKPGKRSKVDPEYPDPPRPNPFDSNDELDKKQTLKPSRKTSSEPNLTTPDFSTNPFDDDEERETSSSSLYSFSSAASAARNKYKNDFRDSGGLENQSVQELENYAVYKAEETTKAGEKLLGSLGGIFSRTWKPKKTRPITGPVITGGDYPKTRGSHLEQREKLGLNSAAKEQSNTRTPLAEPTNAFQKVELEKEKQDDALSDLSNLLGELKDMAVDMGTEIERQTKALDHFQDDVDELNFRVKGANQRGRRLLGK